MTDFDVSGWSPRWMPARDQLDLQRTELLALRGHQIIDAWLVWDLEHDSWFADLPVVLTIDDGRQLEVSWEKLDDLSITWNTIDLSTTPVAWVTWPLAWRSQAHGALRAVTGKAITEVTSTEQLFSTRADGSDEANSTWLLGGVCLRTEGTALHIYNALDENGLENELADSGLIRLHALEEGAKSNRPTGAN